MSRWLLGWRLAVRDLRRRATETLLLFVALGVTATTLAIGLMLHGQTATPYALTRSSTAGPDVVAAIFPPPHHTVPAAGRARLQGLAERPEVASASRQFPTTWTSIEADGVAGVAEVQGRDQDPAAVDRPHLVAGRWVGAGGVVVERAFAEAMGLSVGDTVELGGRRMPVVGVAVSAALPPYPQLCTVGCILDDPSWMSAQPGLVWTTRSEAAGLATAEEPLVWFQYLRLHDPASASAFAHPDGSLDLPAGRPQLTAWQDVAGRQAEQVGNERAVMVFGSSLLVILSLATLAVLVGARMGEERRRVGTLKAAGASPGYVAGLLLTSYLAIGSTAALVGLAAGQVVTPRLVTLSAGLLGEEGPTSMSLTDALVVVGSVLVVVVLATSLPAWRAARTSTIASLSDRTSLPRRHRLVLAVSARLPAAGLLGLRLAVRRSRRAMLTALSIAVVVCAGVVVLFARADLRAEQGGAGGPANPVTAQLGLVTTTVTVLLATMAAVNLLFVARASSTDAGRVLAVARAVGVTPSGAAAAIGVGQLLPAVLGMAVGGVSGTGLYYALSASRPTPPPLGQFALLGLATLALTVALTAIPARWESRRPIAAALRAP